MSKFIQTKVESLAQLCDQRNEIEELIKEDQSDLYEKIALKEQEVQKLREEVSLLEFEIIEATPNLQSDLEDVEKRISDLTESIKDACHKLPAEVLREGKQFESSDKTLHVAVSRVTTVVSYSNDILEELPGLANMHVDGDPVLVQKVDPVILGRLIGRGEVLETVAEKYRTEGKKANPSVKIEERR